MGVQLSLSTERGNKLPRVRSTPELQRHIFVLYSIFAVTQQLCNDKHARVAIFFANEVVRLVSHPEPLKCYCDTKVITTIGFDRQFFLLLRAALVDILSRIHARCCDHLSCTLKP